MYEWKKNLGNDLHFMRDLWKFLRAVVLRNRSFGWVGSVNLSFQRVLLEHDLEFCLLKCIKFQHLYLI